MGKNWYTHKIEELFEQFHSTIQGLSDFQITENRRKYGENIFNGKRKVTLLSIFISQFESVLIYILLAASLIVFVLGEYVDGSIILFILLLNAVIGTLQEGKARDTLKALESSIESRATVVRNGKPTVILDKDVVPGDILLLKDGDLVTADARIIEVNRLLVNEASLTGESNSVLKRLVTMVSEKVQTSDQVNMVFKGTYVISGLAKALVVGTGKNTAIGGIAKKLDQLQSEVPLKENIKNLSKIIVVIVGIASALIFIVGIINGQTMTTMFITVVAVAVSAIPESLPVVVTLVLVTGVFRMSKRNVLVKRLQAVEALGQTRVIALDKTGTITKNQMEVKKLFVDGKLFDITGDGYNPRGDVLLDNQKITPLTNEAIKLAGKISAFTAIAEIVYNEEKKVWERIVGDPTEAAIKVFAEKIGLPREDLLKQYPQTFEIPFDFRAKHHSVINDIDGKKNFSSAGGPEVLLKASKTTYENGEVVKLTEDKIAEIKRQIIDLTDDGYRVLALATDFNPPKDTSKIDQFNLKNLTFVGLVGIIDTIREEVEDAVKNARRAGMRVVMITGDHKDTAISIANKVGILSDNNSVMTGLEIEEMTEDEIIERLDATTIFARVSPENKLKVIEAFKKKGDVIAMTGDGINDALSLTAADLGVAMGKIGTEVAREAADLILLDDNFDNIIAAVEEGRSIYRTIRKSVLYLLSTNVGEIMVIVIAVSLGLPLPLLASQIIWLNMVTDTFLVVALAFEPREKGLLLQRFEKPSKWFVDRLMAIRILLIGGVMTAGTLILFVMYLPEGLPKAWTVSLTTLTVFQWYNIFNIRSEKDSIFTQNPFSNKWLIAGLLVSVGLHFVAIYTPFMQHILKTVPIGAEEWIWIMTVALSIVLVEEVRKMFYRRSLSN